MWCDIWWNGCYPWHLRSRSNIYWSCRTRVKELERIDMLVFTFDFWCCFKKEINSGKNCPFSKRNWKGVERIQNLGPKMVVKIISRFLKSKREDLKKLWETRTRYSCSDVQNYWTCGKTLINSKNFSSIVLAVLKLLVDCEVEDE